ncbi:putative dehydrogenase [Phyllobacterium endophyticum]|nr:putative dehydrogenase [Phyllobacterium endophyticum]
MIRTCERHGVTFGVNHFLRASRLHRRMQEMIAQGVIGDVRSILIVHVNALPDNFRLDTAHGRAISDLAVQDIDLARFLLKQEPLTVVGVGSACAGSASLLQDQAMYSIVMSGGAFLQVHESFASPFVQSQVFVLGSLGYLHARGTLNQHPSGSLTCVTTGEVKTIPSEILDPDAEMIQSFLGAIGSNSRPLATGWDGLAAIMAAEAVAAAIASGRAVNVASGRDVCLAVPPENGRAVDR